MGFGWDHFAVNVSKSILKTALTLKYDTNKVWCISIV